MDEVVSQIVGPVVNILNRHVTKQLGYISSSRRYVTKMRNRMKVLEGKRGDVNKHLERNKIHNREIPARVEGWLVDVENVKKYVESISSHVIGCLNVKMRYQVGKNALQATESIENLIIENSGFVWTDVQIPLGRVNSKPTSSSTSTPFTILSSSCGDMFKSRDIPFNDALKFLEQDDNKVIALCGMVGVGKTTMMEQLKKVANDKRMFDWIVKVVIGRNPNMISIQNDIALCIGEGLREVTETARAD